MIIVLLLLLFLLNITYILVLNVNSGLIYKQANYAELEMKINYFDLSPLHTLPLDDAVFLIICF